MAAVLAWVARARIQGAIASLTTQSGQSAMRVAIGPSTTTGDMGAFQLDPTEVLALVVYPPPTGYAWSYLVAPLQPTSGGGAPPSGPPAAAPPTLLLGAHDDTGATFTPPLPMMGASLPGVVQGPQGLPSSSIITASLVPTTSGAPLKSYTLRVASGSSPMPAPLPSAVHPGHIVLTDADSGQPPLVALTATVRLSVDPSTGYQWSLNTDKTKDMTVVGHRVDPAAAGSPPGSPATAIWEFQRTAQSGTAVLELQRPGTAAPAKSFMVTIYQAMPLPTPPPASHSPGLPPPTHAGLLLSDGEVMQSLGTILLGR